MAGAIAVAVGTANFYDPYATVEIINGIQKYMKENQICSLDEIRGCIDWRLQTFLKSDYLVSHTKYNIIHLVRDNCIKFIRM